MKNISKQKDTPFFIRSKANLHTIEYTTFFVLSIDKITVYGYIIFNSILIYNKGGD
jgi:hypothetical protein